MIPSFCRAGVPDARLGSSERVFVLLCRSGEADPSGSPPENHPQAGGRRAGLPGSDLCRSLRRPGRPSIPPERLLRAMLLQEHFSVDGTLIEAWASLKSFKPKDGTGPDETAPPQGRNPEVNFRGERRSNETHASTTDPDARLYRKGNGMEAKLCFMAHALMENRNGLIVDACVTQADGHAERIAALALIEPWADRPSRITLGADKAFDTQDFVNELRTMSVTPPVAQNTAGRRSAIDGRVTRHAGYALSQTIRKRIEEVFGWAKEIAGLGRTRFRGRERVGLAFGFAAVAYNLVRLPRLLGAGA